MTGESYSDITILGAGPAGLTAAIKLGMEGIACLLIDGGKPGKDKICGDGLSGKVFSTLNKLDPQFSAELAGMPYASPSGAVRFYSPGQKMVQISFSSGDPAIPPGLVCKRKDFDRFLLEKALSLPWIEYRPETIITRIIRKDGIWELYDDSVGLLARTRLLLMATGSDRRVIGSVVPGNQGIRKEGIGVRAYFDHVTGSDNINAIEIHFLKELLPWYFWIFPFKDGSANVGLALPMDQARKNPLSLKELLLKVIGQHPYLSCRFNESRLQGKIEAHRLPFFTGRQPLAGDGYMLLGDAACLIDPFTGEGISHAMISGLVAAETAELCHQTGDFSKARTITYEEAVYSKLGSELELGLRLQELARKQRLLNLVIGRASKNEKVRLLLEDMLTSMNTKGKLSQPMFYLKLMLGL